MTFWSSPEAAAVVIGFLHFRHTVSFIGFLKLACTKQDRHEPCSQGPWRIGPTIIPLQWVHMQCFKSAFHFCRRENKFWSTSYFTSSTMGMLLFDQTPVLGRPPLFTYGRNCATYWIHALRWIANWAKFSLLCMIRKNNFKLWPGNYDSPFSDIIPVLSRGGQAKICGRYADLVGTKKANLEIFSMVH